MANRFFFGLWPSERQREALRDPIKAAIGGVDGQPVLRGNWHVTLVFLGPLPGVDVPELQAMASEIEVEPFRLRLDRLEFWPRPKIACLLATSVPPELQALHDSLEKVAGEFGYREEERIYRPHVTVVRNARAFPPQPLAQPILLEWSRFELLVSSTTTRGVRYSLVNQGGMDDS